MEMKLASILAFAVALPASADTVHWNFSESTGGEDVYWLSPTATDPQADQFEYVFDLTYIGVDVIFLGIVLGPYDVTNELDPELLHGEGTVDGPAPIVMMDEPIEADADSDGNIDVAADIFMQVNGKGRGQLDITNVYLGTVLVDTGFPFGWQEVQIDRIYIDGEMDITDIDLPCAGDIDGDGAVDVTDILITIGNWGGSGDGDINGDGVVDVSDILALVASWGPCP